MTKLQSFLLFLFVVFEIKEILLKMSKELIALVTGYTGESGKALLQELIKSNQFKKIILVGRRQVDYTDNEYKEKTVFIQLNIFRITE
jgi:hypothetical protein